MITHVAQACDVYLVSDKQEISKKEFMFLNFDSEWFLNFHFAKLIHLHTRNDLQTTKINQIYSWVWLKCVDECVFCMKNFVPKLHTFVDFNKF